MPFPFVSVSGFLPIWNQPTSRPSSITESEVANLNANKDSSTLPGLSGLQNNEGPPNEEDVVDSLSEVEVLEMLEFDPKVDSEDATATNAWFPGEALYKVSIHQGTGWTFQNLSARLWKSQHWMGRSEII